MMVVLEGSCVSIIAALSCCMPIHYMFNAHDKQTLFMAGGGLDNIVVLMEGESLFNDATSIVLFEIFFEMVKKIGEGKPGMDGTFAQEGVHILGQIAWLTAGNSPFARFTCAMLCFTLCFCLVECSTSWGRMRG